MPSVVAAVSFNTVVELLEIVSEEPLVRSEVIRQDDCWIDENVELVQTVIDAVRCCGSFVQYRSRALGNRLRGAAGRSDRVPIGTARRQPEFSNIQGKGYAGIGSDALGSSERVLN